MKLAFLGGILGITLSVRATGINLGNILTLGDSITQGLNESGSTPGAWRSPFFQAATAAGDTMQFVGTYTATPDSILTAAGQTAHDGWSGYEIDNDPAHGRAGIDELFKSSVVGNIASPNWVLVMIGTNDVDQENFAGAGVRFAGLLSDIHTAYPNATIVCDSTIPNLDGGDRAANRLTFNTQIQQAVVADQASGFHISFVDAGSMIVPAVDMIDPLHPNQTGDNIIGQANFNGVIAAQSVTRPVVVTSALTIAGTTNNWASQFDIMTSDLIVQGGNLVQITNQVASGYAGGTWTGQGIVSSSAANDTGHLTAVGVIQNNDGNGNPIHPMFDGLTSTTSDVLVKHTYYGDALLTGSVTTADYTQIDNGFLSKGKLTGWQNGDFNYDGVINGSDYTLIDDAFNMQGASLAATVATPTTEISPVTAVPEPAGVGGLVAVVLLSRRKRNPRLPWVHRPSIRFCAAQT